MATQIRISKSEARNKFKIRKLQCSKQKFTSLALVIWIWVIEFCFGFRASDFEFLASLQLAQKLKFNVLPGHGNAFQNPGDHVIRRQALELRFRPQDDTVT